MSDEAADPYGREDDVYGSCSCGETRRHRHDEQPRLVDLFCKAGGMTKGYQRAGFYVIGVDIEPQPNYCGDEFIQADATDPLNWPEIATLAAVHASPPCQFGTAYKRRPDHVRDSPNLIPEMRRLLKWSGLPYVIENLWLNRKHLINPVLLCGSMFGLDVERHRGFETNWPLTGMVCDHSAWAPRFPSATNRENLRKTVEIGAWRIPLATQQAAMGVDWMTLPELSEAIPPAYAEFIGRQLIQVVSADLPSMLASAWASHLAAPGGPGETDG
jgi:DNA (cytosine-5)-methyltransferase 1